jgi:hypothetical protein
MKSAGTIDHLWSRFLVFSTYQVHGAYAQLFQQDNQDVLEPIVKALAPMLPNSLGPPLLGCPVSIHHISALRAAQLSFEAIIDNCPHSWGLFVAIMPRHGIHCLHATLVAHQPSNSFLCHTQIMQRTHLVHIRDNRSKLVETHHCIL